MATIVNPRDVILQATSPRILPVTLPSNVTLPAAQVSGLGTLATKSSVAPSDISGLGALAVKNKVDVALDLTAPLTASNIGGLGALAVLNQINLGTQTTGKLDAETKVTNLGNLAFANSLAANQIGAGTLAAGVIYSGSILASQITTGTMTSGSVNTSGFLRAYGTYTDGITLSNGSTVYPTMYGRSTALTSSYPAVLAEATGTGGYGLYAIAKAGNAVYAHADTGAGVYAYSNLGTAVFGQAGSASAHGVYAQNSFGGVAMYINGKMAITNGDVVTNLNADKLDDLHASAFAKVSTPASSENILRASATRVNLGSSPARSIIAYLPIQVGSSDTYYVALY